MSRYTELAEKATPLPWDYKFGLLNGQGGLRLRNPEEADLIVALINAAPDIERLWKAADYELGYLRAQLGDEFCDAVESLRSLFGEEQK